ncbi:hypothetical protein CKA32_003511 [Geitlerinema sp. FC II]|nr:hypothetical protein CKA32_003511 [Geitlerinema sp. FC II]
MFVRFERGVESLTILPIFFCIQVKEACDRLAKLSFSSGRTPLLSLFFLQ